MSMKKLIKYVPDIFIMLGVLFFSTDHLISCHVAVSSTGTINVCEGTFSVLGIMLFAVGIDILFRKYYLK
jgi:hypothetical protein